MAGRGVTSRTVAAPTANNDGHVLPHVHVEIDVTPLSGSDKTEGGPKAALEEQRVRDAVYLMGIPMQEWAASEPPPCELT